MAQTEEFMLQNVAYRPNAYKTNSENNESYFFSLREIWCLLDLVRAAGWHKGKRYFPEPLIKGIFITKESDKSIFHSLLC